MKKRKFGEKRLATTALPTSLKKITFSICNHRQTIIIVNYNYYYYKRLHEIINSDKMSEKHIYMYIYINMLALMF